MPRPRLQEKGDYSLIETGPHEDDARSDYSMDMINDPRFTTPTVLDKRLFAFTAQVGLVAGLTAGSSLARCFGLERHLAFGFCSPTPLFKVVQSCLNLVSFFGMSIVLCLSLYCTLVSVNQSYYGNRLMTAGTNGFELARWFYMNPEMVLMRHRSIKFLTRALILLLLSSGGMLYVKFCEDQDVEAGYETNDEQTSVVQSRSNQTFLLNLTNSAGDRLRKRWSLCESHVHPAGILVVCLFSVMSFYLYRYIQLPHETLFRALYRMRYQSSDAFGRLLDAY